MRRSLIVLPRPAHRGHQTPPTILAIGASQRWPRAHFHDIRDFESMYCFVRHSPPRDSAACRASSIVFFLVPAHSGHHVPCLTLDGTAAQRCPCSHSHISLVVPLT